MIINEKGLVRCLNRAYKRKGYSLLRLGDDLCIYTDEWFVRAVRKDIPNEVHSAIMKHAGCAYLDEPMPLRIIKDMEPQILMHDVAKEDLAYWTEATEGTFVKRSIVSIGEVSLFQESGEVGECYGVYDAVLDLLEPDVLHASSGVVWAGPRVAWGADGEMVVCKAYRAMTDPTATEEIKTIWAALEGIYLQ